MGNICLQLAPESKFQIFNNVTNETYMDTAAMEAERLHVSATLACLTAVIQVRSTAPGPTSDSTSEGGRLPQLYLKTARVVLKPFPTLGTEGTLKIV